MQTFTSFVFLSCLLIACGGNQNLAQTSSMQTQKDSLTEQINKSGKDTVVVDPYLKDLQKQFDFVISFGKLNYAWAKTGNFFTLARQNNVWKLYKYNAKLSGAASEKTGSLSPINLDNAKAEVIYQMYEKVALWKTNGDADGNWCNGNKNCNINDAETWVISVATPQQIHTTTYYAPQFFEECCPGNPDRKNFVSLAEEILKVAGGNNTNPEM